MKGVLFLETQQPKLNGRMGPVGETRVLTELLMIIAELIKHVELKVSLESMSGNLLVLAVSDGKI